jgi:hypothetical protein
LFDGEEVARVGCSVAYSGKEESGDGVLIRGYLELLYDKKLVRFC